MRIGEELRLRENLRAAVDAGYTRPFFTIWTPMSQLCSTAIVLFQICTGPIRLRRTLKPGVIINLFSALIGTKVIFDWINMRSSSRL